ncbi:3'(2'),5'-bisphosphate nucleotidase CysQ [Erythrobacter sp. W53]|uniref:3'(2'),5'-bisphosphate nucleotidase CysQ n=1 Tax=Erythrobacter sp. W53 TaxID=3425947 RepID=UPI003D766E4B
MSMTDGDLAADLALEAGKILLELREQSDLTGKELGNAGDACANAYLVQRLRAERPDDGLLSEESKDTEERLSKERTWIIDPVDGTREYGEGRHDWAVHVGLSIGGEPALGAVALPELGEVLRSDAPRTIPETPPLLRMVVSRSRPANEAVAVAKTLGAQLVPMGSAGAKAMAVIRGEADIYLHSGGQYEWDNCAPAAVAIGHGLHASRIDGSPLIYNNRDTYVPDLLICRKEHASRVLDEIAKLAQ